MAAPITADYALANVHTINNFYQEKLGYPPGTVPAELSQFNVFRFEDFAGPPRDRVPFSRADYHKISLLKGRRRLFYPDQTLDTSPQALLFSNPHAPYQWAALDGEEPGGCCCVFTPAFLQQFGPWQAYPVFQPGTSPVLGLTPAQASHVAQLFQRMHEELHSTYTYKYDALRTLLFELMHTALKLLPPTPAQPPAPTAAQRLTTQFLELLERQFPVDNPGHLVRLRSARDFADVLAVHVNHLNKALRETTAQTTSDFIARRVLQEAKILLKSTAWPIADIAQTLGFKEVTHFANFFRKHAASSPSAFRMD